MGISLAEATGLLLAGKNLTWSKYKDHKAGSISLDNPEQRRMLAFLLRADSTKVASGDESLFDGLVAAWEDKDHDPAKAKGDIVAKVSMQSWRLYRVEAFGFGGLTIFGGKPFDLYIGGHNWCLEGQNGSGKTSLVSAILWALTGKRIREHEGPVDERGEREGVESDDGRKVGNWPPLASYPTTVADLGKQAEVWVRLTFKAANGDTATAYRRLVSPPLGDAQIEEQIDECLRGALRLAEIGVLMPARLAKIGFGKNSLTLYEAVKQLTGLDQLSDVADGCTAFGAGNRKFMKYAKDKGVENYERKFADNIASAKQLADEFDFKLPETIRLGEKDMDEKLKETARIASEDAGKHLETLKSEIPASIDTTTVAGRNAVKTAVSGARGIVTQGSKGVPLFQTWKALTDAATRADFINLPDTLETAKTKLKQGLEWHDRQTADGKLRLKALAAQSFLPVTNADADCPLCEAPLNNEKKRALAIELEELKTNSDAAERKISDVCRSILGAVAATLPVAIRDSRTVIDKMAPVEAYAAAMREKFVTDEPFSNVLTGIAASVTALVEHQKCLLPHFSYAEFKPPEAEPEMVTKLRREIHALERLIALVEWWKAARPAFVDAWNVLIGKQQENGTFPANTSGGPGGRSCQRHQQATATFARRANLSQPAILDLTPKSAISFAPSRSRQRGGSRSSRTLGTGCDGRAGAARRAAPARTEKSRGPGTPTLVSSLRMMIRRRRWLKSPAHRGDREVDR